MPRDSLTYRHPRTLIEAFGCDASNAYPIERCVHPRRKLVKLVASVATFYAAVLAVYTLAT